MRSIQKIILSAFAFVVSFVVVKYGLQLYNEHAAGLAAERSIEELRQQGIEKHPEMPVLESMYHEAAAMGASTLNNESDPKKRLATAATMFLGFYLTNARERPEFCKEYGVNISPFVYAFSQAQKPGLAKAEAALSGTPYTQDKLYAMFQPQIRKVIIQDMQDIATKSNTTIKGACELIATNGEALASKMRAAAAVYQALEDIQ